MTCPTRKAFSLRDSLVSQGVTDEKALRGNMDFVFELLRANPSLDVTRYRVTPAGAPDHG